MSPAVEPQRVFDDDEDPALLFAPPAAPAAVPTGEAAAHSDSQPKLMPLAMMQANPENPRPSKLDLQERADDLRARGQLQNVNLMSLDRFLEEKPYLRERLDLNVPFVIINGCLRHAAAPDAGLKGLKFDVRDEWTADDIDECIIAENVHRDALNPMLLARKLEQMLTRPRYGSSARKLGLALSKKHPWVPERLSLLKLHPDLQEAVAADRIKFNLARHCSRLHVELQPKLVSGELPEDVARAWLITLKIKPDEQMKRWQAGSPFDIEPERKPTPTEETTEETPAAPVAPRPKPVFSFRLMDRSPDAIRAFGVQLRDELSEDERTALVQELTSVE